MTDQKTLFLTLSEKPFEVMLTSEKKEEFRKPSKWIKSRLFNKDGTRRDYDVVKFVNGYGNDKPTFTAIYDGFTTSTKASVKKYSNGLTVQIKEKDFVICLGDVISKKNIKRIWIEEAGEIDPEAIKSVSRRKRIPK